MNCNILKKKIFKLKYLPQQQKRQVSFKIEGHFNNNETKYVKSQISLLKQTVVEHQIKEYNFDPLVQFHAQQITQPQKQTLQDVHFQDHQGDPYAESPNMCSSFSNKDTMLSEVLLTQEDSENQDIQFEQIFEEESSFFQNSSSPKVICKEQSESNKNLLYCQKNQNSVNNYQNLPNDKQQLKYYCEQLKSLQSENSKQINSQNLIKTYFSENKNQIKQEYIPSYKILPIDYDDLPRNQFHLYGDIFIELMKPKQSSHQVQQYSQEAILEQNKQINPIFQWKHINQIKASKRELIFDLSSKIETNKNFNSIINILKALNQQQELTKLLIEAENNLFRIQNSIKDGFNLMRQNELIELFYERRQLFENKCEFFLREISGQKKYIFLKSYYNEDKLEIEYSQMGISANLVEILSGQQVNQVAYKIMRGNYPEILGNKLKEIWSQQSVIRLLSFEQNHYKEQKFKNIELSTLDGISITTTMTVKKVQFCYDPIYENLPLKDQFIYIEFNVSPKILQQLNKMRSDIPTPKLECTHQLSSSLFQDQLNLSSTSIFNQIEVKKSQSQTSIDLNIEPFLSESFYKSEQTKNNDHQSSQQQINELDVEKHNQFMLQQIMESLTKNKKYILSQKKIKQKAFNYIKNKKRKQHGFIEEDNKDFYYEMQTQLLLDKFYNYEEVEELIKQSFQTNNQNFPQQDKKLFQNFQDLAE